MIETRLHASISYANFEAIWKNIQKRYLVPNVPKIHQLKAEIALCKQGTPEIGDFFNKLMGLWNELENCTKIPTCVSGAVDKYVKMAEDGKAHKFLMDLDDDLYSNVGSQILGLDPLPSLDRIYSMV